MIGNALALARRGFKVFPIAAGSKTPPLVKSWQTVATSDEKQITSWWTQWPTANPGVHCDSLLVLDVDPKKDGYESLEALEAEIELEATYEVETPSGGRHIYYRLPAEVVARNGVDVFGRGIDVRTQGGYVLGAGSSTDAGIYRSVCEEPIAGVDPALLERARVWDEPSRNVSVSVDTDADTAYARAVEFLRAQPAAAEGTRNHKGFAAACRCRDFGCTEEQTLAAMLAEFRAEPPLDEGETEHVVHSAYRYAQDAAGKLTPEALGFEVVPDLPPETKSEVKASPPAVDLLHPADASLDEILGTDYLIKGVLERESNAVLFGHWNVGKTFVVLDMAASIATGAQWFGKRVRQGRVLYLGYEGIRAMKKRMIALRNKYPALEDHAVPFEWHPMRKPLTTQEGNSEMIGIITAYAAKHGSPNLIVVDPLANALGGDDADANLMGLLNTRVAELMQKQHCTVLRVHHSGHGNQDRARGHSSLPAGLDTEIRVTEQEIALTKQRDDVRGKLFFRLDVVKLGKDSDGDDVTTCVVEQIEENAMSPDLTGPQRALLDELIKLRGNGGVATKTDVKDCSPGITPEQRRELLNVLERKQYLRAQGSGWLVIERGPMAIFD